VLVPFAFLSSTFHSPFYQDSAETRARLFTQFSSLWTSTDPNLSSAPAHANLAERRGKSWETTCSLFTIRKVLKKRSAGPVELAACGSLSVSRTQCSGYDGEAVLTAQSAALSPRGWATTRSKGRAEHSKSACFPAGHLDRENGQQSKNFECEKAPSLATCHSCNACCSVPAILPPWLNQTNSIWRVGPRQ